MMPCLVKRYLGIECIGCGFQRSFIELLKGNFSESIKHYPALLPLLFMLTFLVIHLIFKFRKGGIVLMYNFILVVTIMVISYVAKLSMHA